MPQLPVIQPREEFGFKRTSCGCKMCALPCNFTPGPLSPSDVERIAFHLGYENMEEFAKMHLLASQGATLARVDPIHGVKQFNVPTLVPRRSESGACHFLQGGRCQIHTVSPFGCAMFDSHMSKQRADTISIRLHTAIAEEHVNNGLYHRLWVVLNDMGQRNISQAAMKDRWSYEEQKLREQDKLKRIGWQEKKDRNKKKRRK